MKIKKTLKSIVLGTCILAGAAAGFGCLNFYKNNNTIKRIDGKEIFSKADGILARTKLEIDSNGIVQMLRNSYRDNRFYGSYDGSKVDVVYKNSRAYYRDKDLKDYPAIFIDADKEFREQMARFKPLIDRYK